MRLRRKKEDPEIDPFDLLLCEIMERARNDDEVETIPVAQNRPAPQIQEPLMASILMRLIKDNYFMDGDGNRHEFLNQRLQWKGTPTRLLEILTYKAREIGVDTRSLMWKDNPQALSIELWKAKGWLEEHGVILERGRCSYSRWINIYVRGEALNIHG